jgi:hypothetical protein
MSSAAVPPEQVNRLRSISNSSEVISISGKLSLKPARFSQWMVQR